jgi:hypothetical protein
MRLLVGTDWDFHKIAMSAARKARDLLVEQTDERRQICVC